MTIFLSILVVVFALAAAGALVRGIVMFLKTSSDEVRGAGEGPSVTSVKQNKMMWRRIQFQFLAVAAAVLLLMLAQPHG